MAGELKEVDGTEVTVISHAATLASGANTYSTGTTMTQLDNSTLRYGWAKAILSITDTFAAAPTAGGTVDLYMTEDDLSGTNDETPVPGATDITYLGKYLGSFIVDNQDVAYLKPLVISLTGVKKARFYILNSTGQQISYSATATTVKITPFSYMPT